MREFFVRLYEDGWHADGAVRPVGRLLIVAMSLAVLSSVLSLMFVRIIVEFQLRRSGYDPDGPLPPYTKEAFYIADCVRIVTVLAIFANYARLIRWLGTQNKSKYRSLLVISVITVAAYCYLLTTSYPLWIHVIQAVQVVVMFMVFILLNRKSVREHFTVTAT
ncbi:hypothetical protein [Rhodococcus sp. MALMAid1271]|uniref:hypothetical protein n=1 Tax=Rhodococcus sp. MALMAid1271 TaxID=3411744 RepID=UPI003BA1E446